MGFKDEVDADKQGGDFYKWKEGEQKFRIMEEPIKKVQRFGHGLCYPGAPYCDPEVIRKEYEAKVAEAKKEGKDVKKISMSTTSTKWMTWAILRGNPKKEINDRFVILDLPKQIAEKMRMWMDSEEYAFDSFPMPYDVYINADENVGTTKVKYDITAARSESPLTEEETEEFKKLTPIKQILERMQQKAKEQHEGGGRVDMGALDYPTGEEEGINPDDIPF